MSPRVLALCIAALVLARAEPCRGASFESGRLTLSVPDGFTIEQVAGPPLVDRPVSASFDHLGRLYVTDSSGSNEDVKKQLEEKPHRVLRLEDMDGDGRFDRSTVFADRMMFPEGCLFYRGSLYVAAPPSIWKLTDTDGDGKADEREEWHQGITLTGCANDLHGPYLGLDGLLYWGKGAFAEQTYSLETGEEFKSRASHVFRKRLDGTGIEPVLTGGMDNPVGVEFTATGERLMVGTFFLHPQAGKRDGIIHAIYGGVYGKRHDVIDGHPRTGDLMPIMTHMGPAAPSDVLRYRRGQFGEAYTDNLFVAAFNLNKVTHHRMQPDGATFRTEDSDLVWSDDPDFHPTDIVQDADGSLLVVDTGGWYKICCPTSQLWKPDVLGAIYRVKKTGASPLEDPRGLAIDWERLETEALGGLLSDDRWWVRERAVDELALRGDEAVAVLQQRLSRGMAEAAAKKGWKEEEIAGAVWALARIASSKAREAVREELQHPHNSRVRHAAAHVAGLWRDEDAVEDLVTLLNDSDPAVRRAAAEALGRTRAERAIEPLLQAAAQAEDRVEEHSITYALMEINSPGLTRPGLKAKAAGTQRAALTALDQMKDGDLKPLDVVPFLQSDMAAVRETGDWVVRRHAGWGEALAAHWAEQLTGLTGRDPELAELLGDIASSPAIQAILAGMVKSAPESAGGRTALEAMGQARLKEIPKQWEEALAEVLSGEHRQSLVGPVATVSRGFGNLKQGPLQEALVQVALDAEVPAQVRLEAIQTLDGGAWQSNPALFHFAFEQLSHEASRDQRLAAARVFASAKSLSNEQKLQLCGKAGELGPVELGALLPAFAGAPDPVVAECFIEALSSADGAQSLSVEQLKQVFEQYPEQLHGRIEQLYAQLNEDAETQKAHVAELLGALPEGDIRRGQSLFNSDRALCSACHAIGYLGGDLGPDLTQIGRIRTERDLLEAVIYPSASFVRSYEPWVVQTADGEVQNGVLKKDAPDEVVLATGPGVEVRIPRKEISGMYPGAVSGMPQGLDTQLTHQELADLLAFLKASKR